MKNKVLITGASGLLGSETIKALEKNTEIIPTANKHASGQMIPLDLTRNNSFSLLKSKVWDTVIHCAAIRSPDVCEQEKDKARQVNTELTERIAEIASERSARFIHISTDYVFDGQTPPYYEESATIPANYYGVTKLNAEKAVRSICSDPIIVRIPVLYGDAPRPGMSVFLENAIREVINAEPVRLDNHTKKHPTYTADVVQAILYLMNIDFTGIIHISSEEMTTNYKWTTDIADALGMSPEHISPDNTPLQMTAARPENSRLAIDKLKSLGAPLPRDYNEVLDKLEIIKKSRRNNA